MARARERDDWDDEGPSVIIEKHETRVMPFFLGIAVGAAAALLWAPQSGQETRQEIGKRARGARSAAQRMAGNVVGSVVDTYRDAREELEDRIAEKRVAFADRIAGDRRPRSTRSTSGRNGTTRSTRRTATAAQQEVL